MLFKKTGLCGCQFNVQTDNLVLNYVRKTKKMIGGSYLEYLKKKQKSQKNLSKN